MTADGSLITWIISSNINTSNILVSATYSVQSGAKSRIRMSPAKGQSPLLAEDSTIQQWSEGKRVLQSCMLEDGRWHCATVVSILLEEGGGGEGGLGAGWNLEFRNGIWRRWSALLVVCVTSEADTGAACTWHLSMVADHPLGSPPLNCLRLVEVLHGVRRPTLGLQTPDPPLIIKHQQ